MLRTFVIGLVLSLPYRRDKEDLHPAKTGHEQPLGIAA